MLEGHKNTKKQGDAGMGIAIGWFAEHGYTVCVPLSDSQSYDLVVDNGEGLRRVQVKTTTYRDKYGRYNANLSVKGWSTRTKGCYVRRFSVDQADLLFIVLGDGHKYLIPADRVGGSTISLGEKFSDCEVT